MKRRDFITYNLAGAALALSDSLRGRAIWAASAMEPADMTEWSIAEIQQKMSRGELGARALTEAYLERIAAIDQSGPAINAIIELNPDGPKNVIGRIFVSRRYCDIYGEAIHEGYRWFGSTRSFSSGYENPGAHH
jgi:hypothetical protein